MRQFRLVHLGVAAALAAAGATAMQTLELVRATGTGTRSVFVPIVPCRLADTRPGSLHIGAFGGPLVPQGEATFAVWGVNGNCTIPTSATGIATNVTIDNPTDDSYLTVYPADAARPNASNLNWTAVSSPTPNQVTVGLSATGSIKTFNNAGTVDVIIDIVGYYEAAGASGIGPAGPPGPAGAPGADGAPGATGNPGPASVRELVQFGGNISSPRILTGWDFLGGFSVVTVGAGQQLVGSGTASVGANPAAVPPEQIEVELCYESTSMPAVITPFSGFAGLFTVFDLVSPHQAVSASAVATPAAGEYNVGLCARSGSSSAISPNANDYSHGWVMVVDV